MQQPFLRQSVDNEQEYRAIEAALLDNPRGRWFLAEHGRRARRLDGAMLAEAIDRLQRSLRQPPALLGQLHGEIEGLKQFLRDTKNQLVSKPTARSDRPGAEPPPEGILRAAEELHELAWTLQSNDINAEACEKIARQASAIYALSLRQALEAERTVKLAAALDSACARLSALLETIGHESQIDHAAPLPSDEIAAMTALLAEEVELAEEVAVKATA
jgi:hypothetical protein